MTSRVLRDYRKMLLDAFEVRRKKNPRYSFRAFARFLEMNPATLSKVINGKRGVSYSVALKVCEKLQMDPISTEMFLCSVESLHARSQTVRLQAKKRLKEFSPSAYRKLTEKDYVVLSDWKYFALLEAFRSSVTFEQATQLGGKLGIPLQEMEERIKLLESVGMLERDGVSYRVVSRKTWGGDVIPSQVIQAYQRSLLEHLQFSLARGLPSDRDYSSMILSVPADCIDDVRVFIRGMYHEFVKKFSTPQGEHVVSLSVQFNTLLKGLA